MYYSLITQVIRVEEDVIAARQCARQIAHLIGFDVQNQTRIATAVSEIARNAYEYAMEGKVEYSIDLQLAQFLIQISDSGPGFHWITAQARDIDTSQSGERQHAGLQGAQRLMDYFHIDTEPGKGTTIQLGKLLPPRVVVTPIDVTLITDALIKLHPISPFAEVQQQNHELLVTLEELRQTQATLEQRVQLRTTELAATNAALQVEMAKRERADVEVRYLNTDLEIRIEERTAELQRINTELEAFSYSVSHDLRAPLRAINGFSTLLLERYVESLGVEGQEFIQEILAGTQRMDRLINDLLSLSRVTRNTMKSRQVNLSQLVQDVLGQLKRRDPDRNIKLDVIENVVVEGDASLLQIALDNLLGNAWKFTQKQSAPTIEFGITRKNEQTAFFIRDNGAGFDMKQSNRLFSPFQRLHKASDFEGTGIGLAIVQRIIKRHGGKIWAEAVADQGATFFFTLSSNAVSEFTASV